MPETIFEGERGFFGDGDSPFSSNAASAARQHAPLHGKIQTHFQDSRIRGFEDSEKTMKTKHLVIDCTSGRPDHAPTLSAAKFAQSCRQSPLESRRQVIAWHSLPWSHEPDFQT
jgi:hypothetical protein